MTMQYAHGSFTWGSGDSVGATYTCSPGFQAQVIRVRCMGIDSGTDAATQTVSYVRSIGFASSTSNRICVGTYSQDGSAAANCSTAIMDNCVLVTTAGSTTITGALDLDSIGATSFDLINDNAPDQNITVFWEAWADDGGMTLYTGVVSAPGAAGDVQYTGLTGIVSGNPDGDQALFWFSKQAAAAVNTGAANDSGLGYGIATGTGGNTSGEQVMVWGNSDDASGTMDTDGACHTNQIIGMCAAAGAATEQNRGYLKSWDTDAFTVTWDAAGSNRMGYAVIKGGRWQAGALTLDTTATSNTASVSSLPFTLVGAEFIGRQSAVQATNVAVAHDILSWGVASGTSSRRAMGAWDENATANAEIDQCIEYDGVLAYPTNAGAIDAVYDVSAWVSDGFTVIVDDAPGTGDASEWIGWLAWGSSGPTTHSGSGAPSLPLLTASGSGTKVRKGTGAPSLPALTASGSGTKSRKGAGAVDLPLLEASGAGTKTRKGTGAATLPLATATGAGTKARKGTGGPSLPLVTASGSGDVQTPVLDGTGAASLPLVEASGTGRRALKSTGAADLPLLTATGAGKKTRKATGAASLPILTASGAGKKARAATGAVTLPAFTATGAAKLLRAGTGAVTLPLLTASGVGKRALKSTGAVDLPLLTASGLSVPPSTGGSSKRMWKSTFGATLK